MEATKTNDEMTTLSDDDILEKLNESTYRIKAQSVYNKDGDVVSEVFRLFDYDTPNEDGEPDQVFVTFLDALHFYGKHLRLFDEEE